MRGRQRVITTVVLLLTLLAGAVIAGLVPSFVARQVGLSVSVRGPVRVTVGLILGMFVVALELGGLRPLALHRQVPQWWGHRYGPVAAAARYGIRLGVGPATILTTWLWWLGWTAGLLGGLGTAAASATGFGSARFATMIAMAWGSPTGTEMAQRVQRLRSLERPVRRVGIAATSAALSAMAITLVS